MKTLRILVFISTFSSMQGLSQVSINSDGSGPHASAMLEVKSTNRGLLLPRMNLANRPSSPATGLAIYQLDSDPGIYYFDGTEWQKMGMAAYNYWNPNGPDIYFNTGRVGIGTTSPESNGLNVLNYVGGKGAVRGAVDNGIRHFATGYLGFLDPSILGAPTGSSPYHIGVFGIRHTTLPTIPPSINTDGAAVYGWNADAGINNYAGLFYANGTGNVTGTETRTNYGLYAVAEKADFNFAGYFKGRVTIEGNSGSLSGKDTTSTLLYAHVNHTHSTNTRAIYGRSRPQPGYGNGVYGYGGAIGVSGEGDGGTSVETVYGVKGLATGVAGTRIGVYGHAAGGTTNWASYFIGSNYMSSDLRIGTEIAATGYKLSINGKIACTEVLVQDLTSWPDYVFMSGYDLMSLDDLEHNILVNGHLPGLPSAQEIQTNGLHLGNMQKQVVEKVEELTLHLIAQGKMLKELTKEIDALKAENASLRKTVSK